MNNSGVVTIEWDRKSLGLIQDKMNGKMKTPNTCRCFIHLNFIRNCNIYSDNISSAHNGVLVDRFIESMHMNQLMTKKRKKCLIGESC